MNIGVHISFQISVFAFFRKILRSEIARSDCSSIFNFLRTSILFSLVAVPIYWILSLQQCKRVRFSLHPHQHLFVVFLRIAILTDVRWRLIMVLVCISLVISDVEHIFMCLLPICMSSLEKCLSIPQPIF